MSEGTLRRWMVEDDVESESVEDLTSPEKWELGGLRPKHPVLEMENETFKRASVYFAREKGSLRIPLWSSHEMVAEGFPIAVTYRLVGLYRPGYYQGAY